MQRITYQTIVKDPEPSLRQKSTVLSLPLSKQHVALAKRMLRYVRDSRDDLKAEKYGLKPAVGLSAPQVGVPVQLIVVMIDNEEGDFTEYILANPKIISHSVQHTALASGEGCLSVETNHPGLVHRHARISVKAYDVINEVEIVLRASGFLAVVLQHEIDHLHGILFYDHIDSNDPWAARENTVLID
jgi:peptide deformylase